MKDYDCIHIRSAWKRTESSNFLPRSRVTREQEDQLRDGSIAELDKKDEVEASDS